MTIKEIIEHVDAAMAACVARCGEKYIANDVLDYWREKSKLFRTFSEHNENSLKFGDCYKDHKGSLFGEDNQHNFDGYSFGYVCYDER